MSDPQRDLVRSILASSPADMAGPAEVQRPLFEQVMTAQPLPDDVVTSQGELGGVPAVFIEVTSVENPVGTILYLHGGAYALGSAATGVPLAAALARRAGATAISLEYRLAPEHPFPAALEDVLAAYRGGLVDQHASVVLAGDSAGGGLAVAALVALRRAGTPLPAGAVLFSPWADLTVSSETIETKAETDLVLTRHALEVRAAEYVGTAGADDPLVSPVKADLAGLPPLLIQVGSEEILLDDALTLATEAARDDVAVTLEVTPRVTHIFQAFAGILAPGAEALDRAGAWVRERLA